MADADDTSRMSRGQASVTAQRVAVQRLGFDRLPRVGGDAAADEALSRDVAGDAAGSTGPLIDYLRARTAFFDREVVDALDNGIRQVVVGAAGYDGRALRYASPGVTWFEVDHPSTQADKRERLSRLGIGTDRLRFVAADFGLDRVDLLLLDAGLQPGAAALILLEGIAAYLDRSVLVALLAQLRAVAAAGSRLAISLSVLASGDATEEKRQRFRAAVAALGEPVRSVIGPDDVDAVFSQAGWRQVAAAPSDAGERRRRAGFVVAVPG